MSVKKNRCSSVFLTARRSRERKGRAAPGFLHSLELESCGGVFLPLLSREGTRGGRAFLAERAKEREREKSQETKMKEIGLSH